MATIRELVTKIVVKTDGKDLVSLNRSVDNYKKIRKDGCDNFLF